MMLDVVTPCVLTSSQKREALNRSLSTTTPPADIIAMVMWHRAFTWNSGITTSTRSSCVHPNARARWLGAKANA